MALGETTDGRRVTLRSVECLGGCGWAPVVSVDERYRERDSPADARRSSADARARQEAGMPGRPAPRRDRPARLRGRPRDIAAYEAYDGYAQLRARSTQDARR